MKKIICAFDKPDLAGFDHSDLLFVPFIRIEKLDYKLLHPLDSYNWLLFTSKNGIRNFDAIHNGLYKGKIAVLGSSTAKELARYGYTADFVGDGTSSSAMASSLVDLIDPEEKILAVLGQIASFNLQIGMGSKHKIDRIDVYNTLLESLQDKEIRQMILNDDYKLILAASPSAVRSLLLNFGGRKINWRIACIGETTATVCRTMGIKPELVATQQNFQVFLDEALAY